MGNFGGSRGGSGGGFNSRGGSRGGGFSSGPREMHKAKCSKCGKDCEVPFKPTPGKDVFCKDCYAKVKPRF